MFTLPLRSSTAVAQSSSIMILTAILAMTCVAVALPVGNSASSKHDLNNLMSLLGKLKDAHRLRHGVLLDSAPSSSSSNHRQGKTSSSSSTIDAAMLLQRAAEVAAAAAADDDDVGSDFDTDSDDLDADSDVMSKRQGAWSFDYGLGGGRFGKRGYPEYGLGGGRFGRDVDHVDPHHDMSMDADTPDAL